MARLPVEHKEQAFDYCLRELGIQHSELILDGIVMEYSSFPSANKWKSPTRRTRNRLTAARSIPHGKLGYPPSAPGRFRRNLCRIRFGPKGRERPLIFRKDGTVLPSSLTSTRHMNAETAKIFERLFNIKPVLSRHSHPR